MTRMAGFGGLDAGNVAGIKVGPGERMAVGGGTEEPIGATTGVAVNIAVGVLGLVSTPVAVGIGESRTEVIAAILFW